MTKKTPRPLRTIRRNIDPRTIALEFLEHEFKKIFEKEGHLFQEELSVAVEKLERSMPAQKIWRLVAGISEGFEQKGMYRLLTNNSYKWSLESIRLKNITMTGMSVFMNSVIEKANYNPNKFAKLWKKRTQKKKKVPGLEPKPERDRNPIVLYEKSNKLLVMDGMRRICIAAIENEKYIKAWVGRVVKPNGHIMINPDKILYAMMLYDEADVKTPELLDAIKRILIAYKKTYRNGKSLVNRNILPWKKDPDRKKTAQEIMKA